MKQLTLPFLLFLCFYQVVLSAQPIGDDLINAVVATSLPYSDTVAASTLAGATAETSEIVCAYDNSWWYQFTPSVSGVYRMEAVALSATDVSQGEVSLGLYTGNTHPLAQIVCQNRNTENAGGELFSIIMTAGTTYYLRVAVDLSATSAATIEDITFSIDYDTHNWVGAVSDDWNNGTNWSNGVVPVRTSIVNILDVSLNTPKIKANTNEIVAEVNVHNAGAFEVSQGGSLTVTGSRFTG
ncbi:MAG: hypothetical protein AAGA62_09755, partial [Bacteroidota bacterium]